MGSRIVGDISSSRFFKIANSELCRLGACSDCDIRGFSSLAEDTATSHPWPGNVRELHNRVERAAADVRDAAEKRQIERAASRRLAKADQ